MPAVEKCPVCGFLPVTNKVEVNNRVRYVVHCNNISCPAIFRHKQVSESESIAVAEWDVLCITLRKRFIEEVLASQRNVEI